MFRLIAIACICSLGGACAASRQPVRNAPYRNVRVAVLPTIWHTRSSQAVNITEKVQGHFHKHKRIDVVPLTNSSTCRGESSCLRELAKEQRLRYLVATDIAELGDTAVLRMRLLDTRDVGADQTRQVTLHPMGPRQVNRSLRGFVGEFGEVLAPTKKRPQKWYRRGWVWIGASVTVSAAVALIIAQRGGDSPDVVITPP